ncbi:type II toxin-antitoxin system VapC family toxin [Candidatus Poriferisodalis sp.]|uniref:type II toxin-antitoxin system VapC family toxin n=1 Tax=Candidatus Poriferisodalis sp. TaxID=3101277 RepID=UPI003B5CDF02
MIVDTSAVLAILFDETDAERYRRALAQAEHCRMSVASYLEAAMVVEGRGGTAAGDEFDRLLERAPIDLVEVTAEHAHAARRAWRRYGKGRHPAGLNFGDCFAYALAEVAQEPLLFKGDDFTATDVEPA